MAAGRYRGFGDRGRHRGFGGWGRRRRRHPLGEKLYRASSIEGATSAADPNTLPECSGRRRRRRPLYNPHLVSTIHTLLHVLSLHDGPTCILNGMRGRIYRLTPLPPTSQLDDLTISRLVQESKNEESKHPRVQYVDCVDLQDCRIFACGDTITKGRRAPTVGPLESLKARMLVCCGLCGFARLSNI